MKSNKPALMERASFKSIVSSLLAILMGLVVGFIIILIANPSDALQGLSILLTGGFREGLSSIGQVIYLAVPIMMTGLSVSFAYKCGEFNIGVPGQYLVGSFTAVFIALRATFIPDNLVWIFAILGAGIAGALWALIPGILKAARNVTLLFLVSCVTISVCYLLSRALKQLSTTLQVQKAMQYLVHVVFLALVSIRFLVIVLI